MELTTSLSAVKGVGPVVAKQLAAAHLETVADLIDYYPRRYDDYSVLTPVSKLRPGKVTIKAVIKQARGRYVRRGMHVTEAVASDETSSVRLVWFNQPYRAAGLKTGSEYYISGDYAFRSSRLSIMNPSVELVSSFPISTARIVPIYKEIGELKSTQVRRLLREVMPMIAKLPESLPKWLLKEQKLVSRADALRTIHFPGSVEELDEAKHRLAFEEVFMLNLASQLNKQENNREHAMHIPFNEALAKEFVTHLPFKLTDAQRKVVWQIYLDMQQPNPMNRLVEGDVGSGKTVVAAMAAVMAMAQGFQVALMAPTELLARQHAETIYQLLEPLGLSDQVGLLVGGLTPKQKQHARDQLTSGRLRFIIGTNALVQDKVAMAKLGLVIVDEQHRFGVDQRKALQAKAGHMPHVLHLTATPIPRSLALTLYGELDISIIETKPAGRKPIITKLCTPAARPKMYTAVHAQLEAGRQVFVVCPLISESESLQVRSAERVYEELSKGEFKKYRVGLLHGRLKATEKEAIMQAYLNHKIDVLVATTVIEVGVNVPNATVMLVEGAERFGLAQLHQLRGRVGRSEHQGYCYLLLSDNGEPTKRLRALESSTDGFRLAELDLELRGPGAIYGTVQHGQLDLRMANLADTKLLAQARQAAQQFIDTGENLLHYPQLAEHVSQLRTVTNLN